MAVAAAASKKSSAPVSETNSAFVQRHRSSFASPSVRGFLGMVSRTVETSKEVEKQHNEMEQLRRSLLAQTKQVHDMRLAN